MSEPEDDKPVDDELDGSSPDKPMRFLLEDALLNSKGVWDGWNPEYSGRKIARADRIADTLQGTVLKPRQRRKPKADEPAE
ncbi:hypothetical protein OVA10_05570 [Lelliottia sp. SL45]|uniref:hypothetical protein n=1 Tax=Enterobacteriaceae TaxID=543 RepID=UPI00192BEE92|nr:MULTISPECIES: hypothetical protein [Enterobacteriaceae]MBL5945011.1 hypothetical protein [Enterobacter asburiae]MBL5953138.1 hypothetical protein [Enterobacter asburiae]MCY1697544.1 hypothetical protein [Lelliottia sp. SL45]